ncbi:2-hydroxyacid dehydrogenase [Phragmitibacter flavus]|uniref:2-hydroxyacid dehydrogenase n=1 Tax=Phragmitibacter flavus TaxID=2576071 RepID=A0A5R8KKM3_9BACT|nr:2-hydroxyacid dehydrogenase [Phragmitibacter flavus]TLD72797.1 2-hydroxyacid dehydrogenase [Phragmitibacter flavus]
MKILVFSSKSYDEQFLNASNQNSQHQLTFVPAQLDETTAALAKDHDAVCIFVNDRMNREVIDILVANGVKYVALRCAGFNQVDVAYAKECRLQLARVPAYSPHAVAEHAVGLLLALNRHLHKAYNRVREGNFELSGLMGFDLVGKTVTIVGTGRIGAVFAKIMHGFGCRLLAVDDYQHPDVRALGATYVSLNDALPQSDVISLHCPLTDATRHLINSETLAVLKKGVLIVNTGRGALVDTRALIEGLKSSVIGGLALDVYEEEEKLFFSDHSHEIIGDDVFMRLTTFPNVLITGHQAFFTNEALTQIAEVTMGNLASMESDGECANAL